MTDTYVEKLIINRLLKLESISKIPKVYQYFMENKDKEDEECLQSFIEAFKPVYEDDMTDDEKLAVDGENLKAMIDWFVNIYVAVYETEQATPEDDELYEAIMGVELSEETTNLRRVNIKTNDGDEVLYLYPDVLFPNISDNRPVDDDGMNSPWYELFFIPYAPNQIELGTSGRSRWVGIMQVNICVPLNWGTDDLYARYDELAALFRSGLILQGVRIVKTYRSSAIEDDDYYMLPITIEWQSDLDR